MARNQALTDNKQQLDQHTQENGSFSVKYGVRNYYYDARTLWPSGLRRCLEAPVRKGVGWNRTGVILEPCWGNLSGELPVFWIHFAVVSPAFWGSNGYIPG